MKTNNQLIKYNKNPIKRFIDDIIYKFKNKFFSKSLWDKDFEDKINREFTNELEQKEVKKLLQELLTRNKNVLETIDVRMLNRNIINLFGIPQLERIVTNKTLQSSILELSQEELKTYVYILNYNTTNINERISNLNIYSCKDIDLKELQKLPEDDRVKAIRIITSNGNFLLNDLSNLTNYYDERRNICQEIIDNPEKVKQEYDKEMSSEDVTYYPFELLIEMQDLSNIDRIRYAIIEAKYGINLEKAVALCTALGEDIDEIEQSEETRIINELKYILKEQDISKLKDVNLDENYDNYVGMLNIIPNLKNAYLHKYNETLYQINEDDYIESQSVKIKGRKKEEVKIYNALGKNNDRANFNMIVTSLGGIYSINHDYSDIEADWNRADENHTISCSYIGNDFLGVVDDSYLIAFSDIGENGLLQASNKDGGFIDSSTEMWEDLSRNKFLTPKNQINSSKHYNELFVERKVEKDGKLVNRKPTFVVYIAKDIEDIHDEKNVRWQEAKRVAAQLKVPIVVIDRTQCAKLEFEKVQDMIKQVKEEKRMDLIPDIIHKIENNRAAQMGETGKIGDNIFSKKIIKKSLEDLIGTIIASDINTFNYGIEEFVNVTKKIKKVYENQKELNIEDCKTYDYDEYINRLKILYISRNGLNSGSGTENEKTNVQQKEFNKGDNR